MKLPDSSLAARFAAINRRYVVRPRFHAAFLLALALLFLAPFAGQANGGMPSFTSGFSNTGQVISSSNQTNYAPHLSFTNGVEPTGPAEVTNGTTMYFAFLSNSLGDVSQSTVGFELNGSPVFTNMSAIPGITNGTGNGGGDPLDTNAWHSSAGYGPSNNSVWMGITMIPGTNTAPVTNYIRVLAFNGNNNTNTNWATTNLALVSAPQVPFTPYLGITFTNYDDNYAYTNLTNVWLSFVTNASISNTIGYISNGATNVTWSAGNVMSDPVAISTVNANGGLAFTSGSSVIGYLSYGAPLGSLSNSPSPVNSNDLSYHTPWVEFELTRGGTAAGLLAGDVGDLTFINEFSAPLYIKSYDTNGNLLQYSGFFSNSTSTILRALAALTQTNPAAVITNSSGQYVRVIAPVSFADLVGPYDNFHSYITNLAAGSTVAYLQNYSAFPVNGNANTNILFRFTMTNHFKSDGTMEIKGVVTASNTVAPYTPANTFSNLKILYATNVNSTVTAIGGAIYGANFTSASNTIFFVDADEDQTGTGANWLAMSNWMVAQYGNSPPNQTGSNAYYTVLAQMVGEVSSTIESGLAGSTNIVSNGSVSGVLGTNLSQNWWTMTNPLSIMRNAQANGLNYNQFGDVIFNYSSNSVYNFSYNDRYDNAKPVVFVNEYNGTNVGSWVIGVGAPVSTVAVGFGSSSLTATPISINLGNTTVGAPSTASIITVAGRKLTGNVTMTAPSGFQISSNLGGPYTTALTLTPVTGNVGPTTVFVRMTANTVGSKSGNVVVKSSGMATQNVAVQGTVNPAKSAAIIPRPTSLTKFKATSPSPGKSKSFAVNTVSINQNIAVTAPSNFQVGLNGEGFGSAVTLPSKGGTVNVRIALNAPVGPVSGSVALQSGTNTAGVSVSGTVSAAPTPTPIPTPKPTPVPTPPPGVTLSFTPGTVQLPSTPLGTPSSVGSFSVSGSGLSGPVLVQGDNPNFQLSLSASGPFSGDPVILTPVSGSLVNVAVYVRTTGSAQGNFTDDIVGLVGGLAYSYGTVNGTVEPSQPPSLTLSPASLSGFQTTQGTPSDWQLLELKGSGLAGKTPITVDAPAGFQVALKASGPWGKSVVPNASRLPAPIYVRLSGKQTGFLPDYSYSGNVIAYGGGAEAISVPSTGVSGNTYPSISLGVSTTKLAPFTTTLGASSAPQNVLFGPSAPCLYAGPITITAPAKYEVSLDGQNYTPSVNYTVAGGDNGTQWVDDFFIRISAKATKGTASGAATLTTPSLPNKNPNPVEISVSGKVIQ
jgi:roadblock/LC7 domain-containing protein